MCLVWLPLLLLSVGRFDSYRYSVVCLLIVSMASRHDKVIDKNWMHKCIYSGRIHTWPQIHSLKPALFLLWPLFQLLSTALNFLFINPSVEFLFSWNYRHLLARLYQFLLLFLVASSSIIDEPLISTKTNTAWILNDEKIIVLWASWRSMATIEEIPHELLSRILEYLHPKDLLEAMLVCLILLVNFSHL